MRPIRGLPPTALTRGPTGAEKSKTFAEKRRHVSSLFPRSLVPKLCLGTHFHEAPLRDSSRENGQKTGQTNVSGTFRRSAPSAIVGARPRPFTIPQ
jgi:hypothetical protein